MNLDEMNDSLRERLKEHLFKNGIKQGFVSKNVGISQTSISMFLANKRNLTKDNLDKIEKFLGE
ncbi:helix-turn-helix domain-containing protein [Inediibacterium massiliense]|uniref:helix-turn-helix domain-containing protein n=1 Tax=Inediibacterium massiliense TaxID=1658111 RepID=UPI0006B4AAF1|nr:helix-turn-helix transcriptional regulator [Inediibacterium massiliense]